MGSSAIRNGRATRCSVSAFLEEIRQLLQGFCGVEWHSAECYTVARYQFPCRTVCCIPSAIQRPVLVSTETRAEMSQLNELISIYSFRLCTPRHHHHHPPEGLSTPLSLRSREISMGDWMWWAEKVFQIPPLHFASVETKVWRS